MVELPPFIEVPIEASKLDLDQLTGWNEAISEVKYAISGKRPKVLTFKGENGRRLLEDGAKEDHNTRMSTRTSRDCLLQALGNNKIKQPIISNSRWVIKRSKWASNTHQ